MTGRGLAVALIHLGLVASLALRLQYDRVFLPRGWAKVAPVDPSTPLRGRYLSLTLDVPLAVPHADAPLLREQPVSLRVEGRQVTAVPDEHGIPASTGGGRARLNRPVAFFLPEAAPDPLRGHPDEELWVEVTLVPAALPRPLRLAVRRGARLDILAVE